MLFTLNDKVTSIDVHADASGASQDRIRELVADVGKGLLAAHTAIGLVLEELAQARSLAAGTDVYEHRAARTVESIDTAIAALKEVFGVPSGLRPHGPNNRVPGCNCPECKPRATSRIMQAFVGDKPLSEAQRDGRACLVCAGDVGPMVPAPGMIDGVQTFMHAGCAAEHAVPSTCSVTGCVSRAASLVLWPGRSTFMCEAHEAYARKIAAALGFELATKAVT